MERELGAGYSFERKPCFVCGSLSHLIKDCDYYEKKMAREAALKSQRVVHANVRQATPAWTNTNRVNKANQFTPRPVQLSNIRPNLSTASKIGRVNVNTGHENVNSGSVHVNSGTQIKSGASRFNTGKQHVKTGRVNVNTGKQHVNSGSVHVNSGTQIKSGASRFNTGKQHVNSGSVHVNSGTQIKSGASRFNTGKQHVNSGSVHVNSGTQIKSGASRFNTGKQHVNSGSVHVNTARVNRPVSNNTSPKPSQVNLKSPKKCFSKQRSPVNRPFSRNTAHKSNKYAVKGKMGTAVKTSAGCVWRKVIPLSNTNSGPTPESNVIDHPLKHMEHRGIFDSGCSGHMTGNRAHLEDYQELSKVGSVTFGGSKGSISGKGTIRLGNLVFDDVAFVKELGHFNLFSISQICDKKLNVLFTEKECFVVSSDFKMPDANQVLLKVPRQHNMYTFDMKNVASSKGYTCLLAKASSDEAKLWHRRLGHLNFKNLNKLVKDNLVRGLPSKSFKNDHTCVACQKGKQHKASYNGTEFKNRVMLEFCGEKGIKQEFSNARTPQQNGVAERMNRTLIEAARTMLADSHLPTTFWAEAVNTACYTFNRLPEVQQGHDIDVLATEDAEETAGPVPATAPTNISPVNGMKTEASYDDDGIITDFNNLPDEVDVSTNHTLRIHIAPSQHIKDSIIKINNIVFLLAFYLNLNQGKSQKPFDRWKWVEDMQEGNRCSSSFNKVWVLVDLPNGAKVIGTKWVYRNKKDAEGQDQEVPSQTDQGNAFATPERKASSEGFKGLQAPLGSKIYRRKPKSTPTPTKILHFEEPTETQVNTERPQAEVQASKKSKELQELAGLEAAQPLQTTMDAETQRQIDLDALLARKLVEQEEEANQVLYERYKKQDQTFVAIGSEEDERAIKRMNEQAADKEKEQKNDTLSEDSSRGRRAKEKE
ncbi:ribonuclease H-like domain-containing protein [Tanacetum coccineum]